MSNYVGKDFDKDGLKHFVDTLPYSIYDFEFKVSDVAKKGTMFDTSTRPFTIADGFRQSVFNNASNYEYIDGRIEYNYGWGKKKEEQKLPTKVVFNDKKGTTTLLYGNKQYDVTTVRTCKDDKFDKKLGFLIAYFQKHSGLTKTQANKYINKVVNQDD